MSTPVHIATCRFRVGEHGVAHPIQHLWEQATPEVKGVASSVRANRAICNRCKYIMEPDELFTRDLRQLACPNCYSSNLSVTEVRFELGYATKEATT